MTHFFSARTLSARESSSCENSLASFLSPWRLRSARAEIRSQDRRAPPDRRGKPVLLAQSVPPDRKAHKALKGRRALRDRSGRWARKAMWDQQARKARSARKALRESLALRGQPDLPVREVRPDRQDPQARLVLQDPKVKAAALPSAS